MKILIVSQYFYPENFKINDLAEEFVKKGHSVTVLTGKPNYPKGEFYNGYGFWGIKRESYNGVDIIRVPLIKRKKAGSLRLILNYFSYAFFASLYMLRHKIDCDVTFCFEVSPITQMYPALLHKKKRKSKSFIWVQDLWPESIASVGKMQNRYIVSYLNSMVKRIYDKCDGIFIQSPAFMDSILSKCPCKEKIFYAPNWAEDIYINTPSCTDKDYSSILPEGFIVMFAGNIGVAQDFESILRAARETKDSAHVKWVILGDGRFLHRAKEIVSEYGLENTVFFLGRYPVSEMPNFFKRADAMLLSLKNEYIFSLTIPAKTQTYMASGKPILTMIDGACNQVVDEAKCGLTAKAGDFLSLAKNVMALSKMERSELEKLGENGRKYYKSHFDKNITVDKIIEVMSKSIDS